MHDLGATLAALIPLAFMLNWLVELENNITNAAWDAVLKQVSAYVGAFALISLYAHSSVNLGNTNASISTLPWQGVAFVALAVAAGGGSFADFLRARNNADPTVKPKLLDALRRK